MKSYRSILTVCALVLALSSPAFAGDKGRGKSDRRAAREDGASARHAEKAKGADIEVRVTISSGERDVIRAYVRSYTVADRHGKKPKGLPPGLARKVARGGELPPGWQKKCVRGEIMPREVFRHCHPLPREIVLKLPAAPPGTILVAVDGKVVRLAKATREILDVFDVR